jgi:TonB family protein
METVVPPPADAELHLLTEWGDPGQRGRTRTAAVLSVLAHGVVIGILVLLPSGFLSPPPTQEVHRIITPLVEPLTQLTQKAPNVAKVGKEFNAEVRPRPRIQVATPSPPPSVERPAPKKMVIPAAPKPAAPAPLPEPPKVEAAVKQPPKVDLSQLPSATPPQIQPEEKPKVTFQNVPPAAGPPVPGRSQVPIPGSSVADAIHQAARGGLGGDGTGGAAGGVGGISLPPIPGSQGNVLPQLLSDSMGVDFVPYLRQILVTVRRNWLNVIPESVKYGGRRGESGIQFSIGKDGRVIKLVIESASGTEALDRAAVAGISASNPFPPLPAEFKGDRIVVQFNFSYNMPRK